MSERWTFRACIDRSGPIEILSFPVSQAHRIPWLYKGWVENWPNQPRSKTLWNPEVLNERGEVIPPMFEGGADWKWQDGDLVKA